MPEIINLNGKEFGYLTVEETYMKVENSGRRQKYCLCNCHCGNQLEVRAGSLTSGNTTSCGCKQKEVARELGRKDSNSKDLTNQVSGGIRFIERTGEKIGSNFCWRCECVKCSEELYLPTRYFKMGIGSCPKCGNPRQSRGEKEIEDYLKKQGVEYRKEYTFKDLVSPRGGVLRFDFAVFKDGVLDYLIEYDGMQHFEPVDYFGGQVYLNKVRENDNIKNEYCKEHGIRLIRFRYDEPINFMFMN